MQRYSYILHKNNKTKEEQTRYYNYELIKMTTYQLKEICTREKLVLNSIHLLNRDELIRLILKYRGKGEASLIRNYSKEGLERLQSFVTNIHWQEKKISLQIPAKITMYHNTEVTALEEYKVESEKELYPGNLLIIDQKNKILAVCNLKKMVDQKYYITKSAALPICANGVGQYYFLYFEEKASELLYRLYSENTKTYPETLEVVRIPILDLTVKERRESPNPLIIDFGTSNSTAGIYTDSGESKLLYTVMEQNSKLVKTPLFPSVIGVQKLEGEQVTYVYGYEAKKLRDKNYLEEELPIFYDIKRFISDAERSEKVISPDGHHLLIERKELIGEYLRYLIHTAQAYFKLEFKRIMLLSPVRQTQKFSRVLTGILSEYQVECSLDEGSSVLFNSLYNIIDKSHKNQGTYLENHWYKALIIDCGGGTTDLTSGKFKIHNHRVSYTVEFCTTYENGETNFGGNNLTFRILQLIKIRLTENIKGSKRKSFSCYKWDIFRMLDRDGKEEIYKDLNHAYQLSEEILPTRFHDYEEVSTQEYFRVKANYYYLFELAEYIKKAIFSEKQIYRFLLRADNGSTDEIYSREAYFLYPLDKWKLSYRDIKTGLLQYYQEEMGNVVLDYYEIQAILQADIYAIMKQFLEEPFVNETLDSYDLIKLSGQSCCVELFMSALKEFIPGKLIQGINSQRSETDLKLSCIYGALRYVHNKKAGYMNINHYSEIGALPYEVTAYTHEKIEKVLIHSLQKKEKTGFISRFMDSEQLVLYLNGTGQNHLKKYQFHHKKGDKEVTFHELDKRYNGKIDQEETDNMINGESKYFVWASREEWGFYVLPLYRLEDKLYESPAEFFDFEDDTWEINFYNGCK